MPELKDLPKEYDFSNGSSNPYKVESRHNLIPACFHCRRFRPVILDGTDYFRYFMRGERLADCFPYLTLSQRELLMSGTHPECWDDMMGPEL